MKRWTASPDHPQSPTHALLDEVSVVASAVLDQGQQLQELSVGGVLVVAGQTGHQDEACPLGELLAPPRPRFDLAPGVRCAVEKMKARRIDDGPTVEVPAPALHLRRRDARRLVKERRQHAGFVPTCVPERLGEIVVSPQALGHFLQHAHRYAKRLVRGDGIARHAVARLPLALAFQLGQDRFNLFLERRLRFLHRGPPALELIGGFACVCPFFVTLLLTGFLAGG